MTPLMLRDLPKETMPKETAPKEGTRKEGTRIGTVSTATQFLP